MRACEPPHAFTEAGRQPFARSGVVGARCGVSEQRTVRKVVQCRGEDELVVGAVLDGPGRRLQCVVELVDRFLVPHVAQ